MPYHRSWISRWSFLAVLVSPSLLVTAGEGWHRHDPDLWHFATRPDLRPPKWEVKVYDSDKLSDGYWFAAPKPGLDPTWGSAESWWGPAIYDGNGELVWSGAAQLDTPNVMDFTQSYVDGKQRLTMLDRDRATATILDNDYDIHNILNIADQDSINGHELNFVESGKTVLHMTNNKMDATDDDKTSVGLDTSANCEANFNGFKERDAKNGEILFDWVAHGHIHLNESSATDGSIEDRCNTYDFIHANSVDKTPDGDYIFSARHCDTIFKISHKDGSIVWRLGGKQSDFETNDVKFSRQHNIRSRGQNETHTLISILDNAKGEDSQQPTHDFSRGLLIALRTDKTPMTASLVGQYDQPRGGYAQRRGNMQVMENGNVFMGWSERALQSEHSPDGTLLMEAIFAVDWFGSYRQYKFPYVGRPDTTPDAKAVAYMQDEEREDNPVTKVFVSWNGDTEVKTWKLYGSTGNKNDLQELESADRKGFETSFTQNKYYKYISLKGLDKDGKVLSQTGTIKTEQHPSAPYGKEENSVGEATYVVCAKSKKSSIDDPVFIFLLSFTCAAGAFLLTWFGILPLMRSKRLPFSRSSRVRGFTLRREEVQYDKVSPDEFDLDDDDDSEHKLPLTENDYSSADLPRSPS